MESEINNLPPFTLDPEKISPTINICSDLLEDMTKKLKLMRSEVKANNNIDLDENLLFLDVSKEVIRVQSLLLFLSQGKTVVKSRKEEILINLSSNVKFETERIEEDFHSNQFIQHQEIIKEYKKQLKNLKHRNKQLKKLIKNYQGEEKNAKSEEKFHNLRNSAICQDDYSYSNVKLVKNIEKKRYNNGNEVEVKEYEDPRVKLLKNSDTKRYNNRNNYNEDENEEKAYEEPRAKLTKNTDKKQNNNNKYKNEVEIEEFQEFEEQEVKLLKNNETKRYINNRNEVEVEEIEEPIRDSKDYKHKNGNYKNETLGSSEKNKNWTNKTKAKYQLQSEINGLDEEIEQLTKQINEYL